MPSLSSGDKLGPYEILAPVGAGGMGEVYRARDPRLGREVAIKVSAERFSERFEREARAIASLNHTNVCHLYDVGPNYLVMELVEGETLRGPLRLEDALPIIRQLIDGIEAAHERNIIHRDLKPANIKITPEGVVKILDFGLAKASAPEPEGNPEVSPTITMGSTQAGTLLGTAAYMSPEQARGKTADKRADIWSFGVVVYELLSGKKAFEGESVVETLGAVLNKEPDWNPVPERALRLLKWCLEKDRKRRLQAIGDARGVLEEPAPVASAPSRSRFSASGWIAAGVFATGLAALAFIHFREVNGAPRSLVRLDVDLGADVSLPPEELGPSVVISPDGSRIIYFSGNQRKLFIKKLDQSAAMELPGADGAPSAFFSTDSQWVGFRGPSALNKISVEGGAVVPLATPEGFLGASWSEDGNILVGGPLGIIRVPSGGGSFTTLMERQGELGEGWPVMLPGGKAVLFNSFPEAVIPSQGRLEAFDVTDHRRKVLQQGANLPAYLPSGHLIYTTGKALFAVPFDLEKLEIRGTAVSVLDDIDDEDMGFGYFSVSRTGTMVYRRAGGAPQTNSNINWLNSAGIKSLSTKPGGYANLRLSPDGRRVAIVAHDESNWDVLVYDLERGSTTPLSSGGASPTTLAWTPDGRYIVFGGFAGPTMWVRSDGSGQPQPLIPAANLPAAAPAFFESGRLVGADFILGQVFSVPVEDQGGQLKAGTPEQLFKTQSPDQAPALSLDRHWLAYQSDSFGHDEIVVRSFSHPDSDVVTVSNNGGTHPVWSGHDLLYQSGDKIMAVSYTVKGDMFVPDKPRVWLAQLGGAIAWDLDPVTQRVAAIIPSDPSPKTEHEIVILQNFFDYLRQRVPVK